MSIRRTRDASTTAASPDRLSAVLTAGLHKLSLSALESGGAKENADASDETGAYGSKRSLSGSVTSKESNVEALGLELNSMYFPSVKIGGTATRLGPRLSTVTLQRPNTGTAPGVVFDGNATVLIISADSGYADKYLSFINAARARKPTAQLPDIEYSFPVPQNRNEPSAYVKNARRHMLNIVKSATLESIGQADFTHDYEQPLTKIYVFFKRTVSGAAALLKEGPYVYLGRFKALPNRRLVSDYGAGPVLTDLNLSRITSLFLRPFDTPEAPEDSIVQSMKPRNETAVVDKDVERVIALLEE